MLLSIKILNIANLSASNNFKQFCPKWCKHFMAYYIYEQKSNGSMYLIDGNHLLDVTREACLAHSPPANRASGCCTPSVRRLYAVCTPSVRHLLDVTREACLAHNPPANRASGCCTPFVHRLYAVHHLLDVTREACMANSARVEPAGAVRRRHLLFVVLEAVLQLGGVGRCLLPRVLHLCLRGQRQAALHLNVLEQLCVTQQ